MVIQKNYRAFYWRRKFLLLRWAALTFQKRVRGQLARRAYSQLQEERRRRREEEECRRRLEEEMERCLFSTVTQRTHDETLKVHYIKKTASISNMQTEMMQEVTRKHFTKNILYDGTKLQFVLCRRMTQTLCLT